MQNNQRFATKITLGKARLVSVSEQVVLALGTFSVTIFLARSLPIFEFGIFASALAVWYAVENLQRSLITIPSIIYNPLAREDFGEIKRWCSINLIVAWSFCLLLFLCSVAISPFSAVVARFVLLSALITPVMMIFLFNRRTLYLLNEVSILFTNCIFLLFSFVVILLGGSQLLFTGGNINAVLLFLTPFLVSAVYTSTRLANILGGLLVLSLPKKWDLSGIWRMGLGEWLAFLANNGMQLVVAIAVGPVGAAVFAATRTLTRPLRVLTEAMNDFERPRLAKAAAQLSVPTLKLRVFQLGAVGTGLAVPYLVMIAIFSETAIFYSIGPSYIPYQAELRLWAFAAFLHMLLLPLEIFLSSYRGARQLLHGKALGSAIVISVLVLLFAVGTFSVYGALIAVIVGRLVMCLAFGWMVMKWE